MELDRDHQPLPAHLFDQRVLGAEGVELFQELLTQCRRILDQLFILQHVERCETTSHCEVIPTERAGMNHGPVQPTEHLLINRAPCHNSATRNESPAETLRDRDNIRLKIPML